MALAIDTFGIGQMRSVVVFMINQPIDNTSGGQDDNYITTVTTRGRLTKKSGKKGLEAGTIQFEKYYELYCRYQSDIVLNSDTRVVVDGQNYQINDWEFEGEVKHLYIFKLCRIDG